MANAEDQGRPKLKLSEEAREARDGDRADDADGDAAGATAAVEAVPVDPDERDFHDQVDEDDEYDEDEGLVFPDKMRLDKWLWAARFYKGRQMAAQAVEGGKVKLNGERTKPAKDIRVGDKLDITIGDLDWEVIVRGLDTQRGPAPSARDLYEETEESQDRRALLIANRKAFPEPSYGMKGRPTKRDRRGMDRMAAGAVHGGFAGPMDGGSVFGDGPTVGGRPVASVGGGGNRQNRGAGGGGNKKKRRGGNNPQQARAGGQGNQPRNNQPRGGQQGPRPERNQPKAGTHSAGPTGEPQAVAGAPVTQGGGAPVTQGSGAPAPAGQGGQPGQPGSGRRRNRRRRGRGGGQQGQGSGQPMPGGAAPSATPAGGGGDSSGG